MLIALQPKDSQGVEFSVASMKMLNALLYASQCAIAQEFGSRENFWRVFQMNPAQDLTVTVGTAELSYFMWGTRRRAVHSTFEHLANTLKDLSYVQEDESALGNAKSHAVFGYVSIPRGKNAVTVTFRSCQVQAYFHPKAMYATIRLESMFSVRSLWTCFLLELGARYSRHPNKVTKGRTIEQWYQRAKGVGLGFCRMDNVHRALNLACKEVESIREAGLCDYSVHLKKARSRLTGNDLLRFESVVESSFYSVSVGPEVPAATMVESGLAPNAVQQQTMPTCPQAAVALEDCPQGLVLTLMERLKLKADKARDVIKTYGEKEVQTQFQRMLAYIKHNPNTLRNPPGFFLKLLEGAVSLDGLGFDSGGGVCVESLSKWAIAEEQKMRLVREQLNDREAKQLAQTEKDQRQILLAQFKGLTEREQQYFHEKALEALKGNPSLFGLVQGNRFHALVVKVYKESLMRESKEECYNS